MSAVDKGNKSSGARVIQPKIQWCAPPSGWVKLNSDAVSKGNLEMAGGGGLLRNENGEFIKAYTAEIWSAIHGLQMATDMGIQKIILESNSTIVCAILNDRNKNSLSKT